MSDRLLVLGASWPERMELENLSPAGRIPISPTGDCRGQGGRSKLKAQGLTFDIAFTSVLKRAQHTLDLTLAEIDQTDLPVKAHMAPMSVTTATCQPQQGRCPQEMGRGAGACLARSYD